jgi:hypothetical protein
MPSGPDAPERRAGSNSLERDCDIQPSNIMPNEGDEARRTGDRSTIGQIGEGFRWDGLGGSWTEDGTRWASRRAQRG